MGLTVNLRHLERHSLHLQGELSPDDLDINVNDEVVQAREPLFYDLEIERLSDSLLVQGSLRINLHCECVRCLKELVEPIEIRHWAVDLPLEGEEKVPVDSDSVDLTPFIREDILLAFPQHPLCQTECSGLQSAPQSERQSASGASQKGQGSSAWAELNKLKF